MCHVIAKLRMATQAGGCRHKVTQCRTRQLGYSLFSLALRLGLKIIDMACTIRRRSWKLVTIVMLCFVVMIVHHRLQVTPPPFHIEYKWIPPLIEYSMLYIYANVTAPQPLTHSGRLTLALIYYSGYVVLY